MHKGQHMQAIKGLKMTLPAVGNRQDPLATKSGKEEVEGGSGSVTGVFIETACSCYTFKFDRWC